MKILKGAIFIIYFTDDYRKNIHREHTSGSNLCAGGEGKKRGSVLCF